MAEVIDGLPDGTPYSPRFGDRDRSRYGGLAQARDAFLGGCGLPQAWAGQAQWRILETGFGLGLNFLVTWLAWREEPQRPRILHFVSTEAYPADAPSILRNCAQHPELLPLAEALAAQWWGLLPGVHRLSFDGGQVLLTLCIGDAQTQLRKQALTVDSVFLDGFSPQQNPEIWDLHTLKAVARCCRPGTRLGTWCVAGSVRDALTQCGFAVQKVPGVPPKRHNLQATFAPRWTTRLVREPEAPVLPSPSAESPPHPDALVIGAGIAGAAVAASLARRGWRVRVLDQGAAPAAGASGLPAGLFAPHVSPDDSVVSRLSRSGVRTTLQTAGECLLEGTDWQPSGVLQHHVDGKRGLPADWNAGPGADWSHAAPGALRQEAGIPPDVRATWHQRGGWIRPAQLVRALLAQPGVQFQGDAKVAKLVRVDNQGGTLGLWQALDAQGQALASAPLAIVATGFGSLELLGATDPALSAWPLNTVRGQVTGARHSDWPWPGPAFPVNGHGNCVPAFPWPGNAHDHPESATADRSWIAGSTFERGPADHWPPGPEDQAAAHRYNLGKLQTLLPSAQLPDPQAPLPPGLRHWASIRCTSPDRLPLVGPVDTHALPGLWVCTAMGARGLTLSLLCGELLAARLMGEPLPVDAQLAKALDSGRVGQRAKQS